MQFSQCRSTGVFYELYRPWKLIGNDLSEGNNTFEDHVSGAFQGAVPFITTRSTDTNTGNLVTFVSCSQLPNSGKKRLEIACLIEAVPGVELAAINDFASSGNEAEFGVSAPNIDTDGEFQILVFL